MQNLYYELYSFFLIRLQLFIFLMLAGYAGNSQPEKKVFKLYGIISSEDSGRMELFYSDSKDKNISDTAFITQNKFVFSGKITEPTLCFLSNNKNSISIFVEPGKQEIVLDKNNYNDYKFNGSFTENQNDSLNKNIQAIENKYKKWTDSLNTLNKKARITKDSLVGKSIEDNMLGLTDFIDRMNYEILEVKLAFIKSHPSSFVSPNTLYGILLSNQMPADSIVSIYNMLSFNIKNSKTGSILHTELLKRQVNTQAYNFITTDIKNKPIKLSQFKGKYLLLDFWASWCTPCRKGNPLLIELYKQYHSKGLEVISIAIHDDIEAWKKAIDKDGIGMWHHVLQGKDVNKIAKSKTSENDIGEKYGIQTIPVKILIDKQGKIAGRYDGDDDTELNKKLAELIIQ